MIGMMNLGMILSAAHDCVGGPVCEWQNLCVCEQSSGFFLAEEAADSFVDRYKNAKSWLMGGPDGLLSQTILCNKFSAHQNSWS